MFLIAAVSSILVAGCTEKKAPTSRAQSSEPGASVRTLQVYIDNSAIQCEREGKSPQHTAQQLAANNIAVIASHCVHITGVASATLCGLKDLNINVHEIAAADLKKARALGFEPVANIGHHGNKSFELKDC